MSRIIEVVEGFSIKRMRQQIEIHARRFSKGLFHPVSIFIFLILFITAAIVLWEISFLEIHQQAEFFASRLNENLRPNSAIAILIIGNILLGMTLVGIVVFFAQAQKQRSLYRQQQVFVSSVTHELRTPLASIKLAAETFKKHHLDDKTRQESLKMILDDVFRLEKQVDKILVSARLDRGLLHQDVPPEENDLKFLIKEAIQTCSPLDGSLPSRVEVECQEDIILESRYSSVFHTFLNFLENSIKFSPTQTPIFVRVKVKSQKVVLSVQDSGYGFLKKDRLKIFKMFERVSHQDQKLTPGTGLGLFIAEQLAKTIRGRVWAESPGLDRGATFYLEFPQYSGDHHA